MLRKNKLRPHVIVLTYVLLASLWILTSDHLVTRVLRMPELQSYKGLFFVMATGALLYWMLARAYASMRDFELSLIASQEQFRLLVENAPESIFIQSGGRFRYVNPAALRLFGASDIKQMLDRTVIDVVPPEHREAVMARIRVLQTERVAVAPREQQLIRIDGTTVDVEVSAAPISFEGQPGAVVFVRDISRRKSAERHEEQLKEQVRQAQKMESLGRLAGGVAHDFNNLLTVINGYSDMLLEELPADHPHAENAQEIRDAGERAAALTRQLLAFSRKDMGERQVIDVNSVVRDTERMLVRLVAENIRISTTLDPAIGPIWADPSWVHQVLMNLVVNSRDAMPDGGTIEVRTFDAVVGESQCRSHPDAVPGRFVRLSVADNGIGMTPDVVARAFEPFYTTKPPGKGTGLGLSTVYGIVHNFGGWISVDSRPGEGTTMNVWLPVTESAADNQTADDSGQLHGHETILLVEDDSRVREATAAMLRHYGYAVVAAGSGPEAVRLSGSYTGKIDLLLSDVMMPEMPGPEVAGKLQLHRPGIKVMLMSGYRPDEMIAVSPDLPFISKPFTAATLARRIRTVLETN